MNITADGTYSFPITPGWSYLVSIAGDFGGGSLAFSTAQAIGGAETPVEGQGAVTAAKSFSFDASGNVLLVTVTGATSPALEVFCITKPLVQIGGGSGGVTPADATPTVLTPSGALELPIPDVTPTLGGQVKYHITPSAECVLTLAAGIVVPSDSTFVSRTIPAGNTCILQIEWLGSFWSLTSIVADYIAPN